MESGISGAVVSRIGLPLSQVSAGASLPRFTSMRSAIRLRISERSAGEVRPQAYLAACAASSASSISSASDRANWQTGLPVIGETLYTSRPDAGAPQTPTITLSSDVEHSASMLLERSSTYKPKAHRE